MSMKKAFDTESMYKKIMPSGANELNEKQPEQQKNQENVSADANIAVEEEILPAQNIMVYIVRDKMKMVMDKMDCCKCAKCKAEILTHVLNQFAPKYIAGTKHELKEAAKYIDPAVGLEVTTAVLHEVLALRKNPRH